MARALRYGEPDIVTSENVGGFACFGLTAELVAEVGYLDERFAPAYFEDNDYHYRVRLAGFELRNAPGCTITHARSATLQVMSEPERQLLAMRFKQNLALYRQKWGGVVGQETHREAQI
jgi:GT2 family glycosyltransferase